MGVFTGGGGSFRRKMGGFFVFADFLKNFVPEVGVCFIFLKSPRKGLFGDVWGRGGGGSVAIFFRTGPELFGVLVSVPKIWSGLVGFVYRVSPCLARCSNMSSIWQISVL